MPKTPVGFRLNESTLKELKILSAKTGITMEQLVNDAVKNILNSPLAILIVDAEESRGGK